MSKTLLLFDIDGTLTAPRLHVTKDMLNMLEQLSCSDKIDLGFVGGSDLNKQIEQLGRENLKLFKWRFSENGLMSYHNDELIHKTSIIDNLGENKYQKLINVCLDVLSTTTTPIKRGNFIELRNGMINISPIGRSCSQKERDEFDVWDKQNKCRDKMIRKIKFELNSLHNFNLQFSIGGQISVDIFPQGWDKTYCLQFVENKYDDIYFFGDKTLPGGNDYELFIHPRVKGISVNSHLDTMESLKPFLI